MRRVTADEGARVRGIRLEALADPAASVAFLETLAQGEARDVAFWHDRAARAASGDAVAQLVADTGERLVGTVTVLRPAVGARDYFGRANPDGRAQLVAVFVSHDHRGTGLLGDLFEAAEDWAAPLGTRELSLDTHVRNIRAQHAYRRLGFEPTGRTTDGPMGLEIEFAKRIAGA